jgi:hypothetical protein
MEWSEGSRPFAMPGRCRLATCRPLVKPSEPLDLNFPNMWGLTSESPQNNRSCYLQKMSSGILGFRCGFFSEIKVR